MATQHSGDSSDLTFEPVVVDGRDWLLWSNGKLLPVVRGGAEDDDSDDDEPDDDGDKPKSDVDKATANANAAEVEKWKALSRKNEKAAKAALAELEKAKTGAKSDADKAIDKARDEARSEATKAANTRVVRAEAKAVAAAKGIDPALAVKLLDLDEFEVDDDGDVDAKTIGKALDALVKQYPGIAGKNGARGDADGGARGGKPKGGNSNDEMNAWLRGEKASL